MTEKKKKFLWLRRIAVFFLLAVFVALGAITVRIYNQVKQVNSYQSEVTASLEKHHMTKYDALVRGIILTESKGKGIDLMQSSESLHGEPNKITDQQASIEQGVNYLSQMINKAKASGCDLWTAVQAYNYGEEYIEYVKQRGGENTVELAEAYSKDVLSPILGNNQRTQYRYWRIESLAYNGGYLYHNGGNMFYAKVVQFNTRLLTTFDSVFG